MVPTCAELALRLVSLRLRFYGAHIVVQVWKVHPLESSDDGIWMSAILGPTHTFCSLIGYPRSLITRVLARWCLVEL